MLSSHKSRQTPQPPETPTKPTQKTATETTTSSQIAHLEPVACMYGYFCNSCNSTTKEALSFLSPSRRSLPEGMLH